MSDTQQEIRQDIAEEFPFEAKNYFYFACKENLTLCMKQKVKQMEVRLKVDSPAMYGKIRNVKMIRK